MGIAGLRPGRSLAALSAFVGQDGDLVEHRGFFSVQVLAVVRVLLVAQLFENPAVRARLDKHLALLFHLLALPGHVLQAALFLLAHQGYAVCEEHEPVRGGALGPVPVQAGVEFRQVGLHPGKGFEQAGLGLQGPVQLLAGRVLKLPAVAEYRMQGKGLHPPSPVGASVRRRSWPVRPPRRRSAPWRSLTRSPRATMVASMEADSSNPWVRKSLMASMRLMA